MTTNQILFGLGLTVVLAVGSQVVANRFRLPSLIVLLPVGFTAGALTSDVNPNRLLGPAFPVLVSLSVAIILYDAGLGLDLRKLRGHRRRVVSRLVGVGVAITWAIAAVVAAPFLGLSRGSALVLGAILVVSGPTVVGPLLNFVRPVERVEHILRWEGALVDPVGGILGAVVFSAVVANADGKHDGPGAQLVQFLASISVGLVGGVIGVCLLSFVLRTLNLGEMLGATAQLACVVGVAAVCDIVRDDSGLIAAIFMGLYVANRPGYDIRGRRPFAETLIQLILGLLFVSISATVTPASLKGLLLPTLGLIAVLVLIVRPIVAWVCTLRTELTRGERAFVAWMAPRGIVAAASASTFSTTLVAKGVGGASKILPVTFLVIVATVSLYGLSAGAVARRLGVTRPARTRPLLVGGDAWVIELGCVLRSAGLEVLMWAALDEERERVRSAQLELADAEFLAAATGRAQQLEGVTQVLLLTQEHDFNALASAVLEDIVAGPVYRLGPPEHSHGVVAPYLGGPILFEPHLTGIVVAQRHDDGARIAMHSSADRHTGSDILFLIRADGQLVPVVQDGPPVEEPGDLFVSLDRAP